MKQALKEKLSANYGFGGGNISTGGVFRVDCPDMRGVCFLQEYCAAKIPVSVSIGSRGDNMALLAAG